MKYSVLILFIICSTINQFAEAKESAVVSRFRQAALNAVTEAESKGYAEIDGVTLSSMKTIIKQIPVYYNPHFQAITGNRRCASWQKPPHYAASIHLNKECVDQSDTILKGIAIHEYLGAGMNRDLDYEISSLMLSGLSPSSFSLPKTSSITSEGGSTNVGGGGDADDLRFKVEALKFLNAELADQQPRKSDQVLREVIRNMAIGPASDIATTFELRKAGVSLGRQTTILYINSALYRGQNIAAIQSAAISAALLYLAYSAEDFGLESNVRLAEGVSNYTVISLKDDGSIERITK